MGTTRVDIEVGALGQRPRWAKLEGVLVDTGAEVSWLPSELLESLGIPLFKNGETFIIADGRRIKRDVGIALLRCGEFKTVDEVVFAKRGDLHLLGARTIEGFNALVDDRGKRLVAGGPLPAASPSRARPSH